MLHRLLYVYSTVFHSLVCQARESHPYLMSLSQFKIPFSEAPSEAEYRPATKEEYWNFGGKCIPSTHICLRLYVQAENLRLRDSCYNGQRWLNTFVVLRCCELRTKPNLTTFRVQFRCRYIFLLFRSTPSSTVYIQDFTPGVRNIW